MLMMQVDSLFFWIPREYHPQVKVTIVSADGTVTDVSSQVRSSEFTRMSFRIGIGGLKARILNSEGQFSNEWVGGEDIYFYADNGTGITATTTRFKGTIDYPKDIFTENDGQVIDIEGRHVSMKSLEKYVTLEMTGTAGTIVKYMFDNFTSGFTTTNINTTTPAEIITVRWSNKPFTDCLRDICILSEADGYIDDDMGVHFFAANSILNEDEAIVEGAMPCVLRDFGKDTYLQKSQVTVAGSDDQGIPVLDTSTDSTSTGEARVLFIKDANVKTNTAATDYSQKALDDRTLANMPPQASGRSNYMLFSVYPGQNIWVSVMRQQVHGIYKVVIVKHSYGVSTGLMTECQFEKEYFGSSQIVRDRIRNEQTQTIIENPNRMLYSYNLTFDDSSQIESMDSTLVIANGAITGTGTFTTTIYQFKTDIGYGELRYVGSDLGASTFEISFDGRLSYQTVTLAQLTTILSTGSQGAIRVTMTADATNVNPSLSSLALLGK